MLNTVLIMNTIFKYETASNAETAQFKEKDINMTEKYFKIRAIVMTMFIIVTFAVFAVSCDKNSAETENSNTTTTQVTTTTSDEDDVTTTTRPKDITTTKATTTDVTTTTSDEEDVTTTTTTTAQPTTTTTKATTTTPQQTTVTTTTTTKQELSENAENVEAMMQSIGITEDAEVIEQYVAGVETLDEMYTALNNYSNDTGKFAVYYGEQELWDIQSCASMNGLCLIEMDGKVCLVESADMGADTLTIDGICMTYEQALSEFGESEVTIVIY